LILFLTIILTLGLFLFWLFRTPPIERYLEKDISNISANDHKQGILTEQDIADFPKQFRNYIRFTKAVGKPLVNNFRIAFEGDFALKIGSPFIKVKSVQYNSAIKPLRLFYLKTRIVGMPLYGRDSYADGTGQMWGRLLNSFPVFNESGEEFRISELVTYLNDAIIFCPAVFVNLKPQLQWEELDNNKLLVSFEDHGLRVSAELYFNDQHVLTNFITNDRFCENPVRGKNQPRYVRAKWSTPLSAEWQELDERMVPKRGRALWHLEEPGFCYADFQIRSFSVNNN